MSKPGRNDPCYCGSGKKYKQCHLRADQEADRMQRERMEAARILRRELPRFARNERFKDAFEKGLPFYWNEYYIAANAGEMSEFEALRYLDWLVFDNRLEDGARIIDLYADEFGDELNDDQRTLLEGWRTANPAGAYELTAYNGQVLELRDVFSDESYTIFEAGGRGNVEIGEVILARLVPVFDHNEFSTVAAYLPDEESKGLVAYVQAAQEAVQDTTSMAEFFNNNNYLAVHYALKKAEEAGRPPVARLDKNRTDPPVQSGSHEHDLDKDRVYRQRTFGSTQPHMAQTRRKAV